MKNLKYNLLVPALVGLLLAGAGCKKDFANPNAATSDQVLNSAKGLMGVAIGIQRTYTLNVLAGAANANGLVTNETFLLNPGNISEFQLSTGGTAVDGTNGLLGNIWSASNKCIFDANNVINGAATLSDKGYASGLVGYATIIKALSIGSLSSFWEKIPDTVGVANATFIDRKAGFAKAIAAIEKAQATIAANAISTGFAADLPAGIDIPNTLNALKARYLLFSDNYTAALAAANTVSLTARSVFNFDAAVSNPIFGAATSTNNLYQPRDSALGLPPALAPSLADKRIPFYTVISPTILPRYRLRGFWVAATTPIPIYLPGEMILIKAEAYARQAAPDLANAVIELNKVVTKTPAVDIYGVGADLPPAVAATVADVLLEIYKNRCIELYFSAFKLEDMRRFGRPVSERKRNFFPYPFVERDGNSNTPLDPAF